MTTESKEEQSSSDLTIVRVVDTIKKSDYDNWNYRGLELSNEMLVVLISHPDIDKAAVALDVSIGSLADPKEIPGMAHFLEHMLFMGSEKYPGENEYDKTIKENGGYANAFTSPDHTVYHFNVYLDSLKYALDVFSQFFVSPLFYDSSIDREIEAVNHEHEGNLFSDGWRLFQVEKSTSDPLHPFSMFGTGNRETLKTIPKKLGINIREALIDFYNKQYSSNRMSLAVLGNQSLDELQSFVLQSFKNVPNRKLEKAIYPSDPYGEDKCKTICYCVPVEETHGLVIKWVVPDYREFYYCHPRSYLSHLVGHEGIGSILAYLRKLNYATALMGGEGQSMPDFSFFGVNIDLTIEGLNHWQDIIYIIYQYLAMLRKEEKKTWIFEEYKNLSKVKFQFDEREESVDYVKRIASSMRNYPLNECLSGPYEDREFRPDLIEEELNKYLLPSKMRVFLSSKNFQSIANEKEKWYGTEYKLECLPEDFIKKCENCELNPELHLPELNPFIPTDFQLFSEKDNATKTQLPIKLEENEYYRLFYAQDSFYKLPKAYMYFLFQTPLANIDPFHGNLTAIYARLIFDSLVEFVYPALLTNLTYSLDHINCGYSLTIYGYNHKIKQFVDQIIDQMINIEINVEKLEIAKQAVKSEYQNHRYNVPYSMANACLIHLIAQHKWTPEEYLSCIDNITVRDVELFIPQMFHRFYIDSLMYGNLTKEQAIDCMNSIKQKFQMKKLYQPIYASMWFDNRGLMLPEGCNFAYRISNDAYKLNAIMIYLECFEETLENNVLLDLFCYLINEPCFNQLRTIQQLGYFVSSRAFHLNGVLGFTITVQTTQDLDFVNQRIEIFLDSMNDYFSSLSDENFEPPSEDEVIEDVTPVTNMSDQGKAYATEIINHKFCFNRRQLEKKLMRRVKPSDVLRFYNHYISPHSAQRRKLAVYVTPSKLAYRSELNQASAIILKDLLAAKTGRRLPSVNDAKHIEGKRSSFGKITDKTKEMIQQPCIVNSLIKTALQGIENQVADRKVTLPKIDWIESVHLWKNSLPCYPLCRMHENLNIIDHYKI